VKVPTAWVAAPSSGPAAIPKTPAPIAAPSAAPRLEGGTIAISQLSREHQTRPAPMPWTSRATSSAASEDAAPNARLDSASIVQPVSAVLRTPSRSLTQRPATRIPTTIPPE
jgi:hypothetical protein